jgi:hypothetical protein
MISCQNWLVEILKGMIPPARPPVYCKMMGKSGLQRTWRIQSNSSTLQTVNNLDGFLSGRSTGPKESYLWNNRWFTEKSRIRCVKVEITSMTKMQQWAITWYKLSQEPTSCSITIHTWYRANWKARRLLTCNNNTDTTIIKVPRCQWPNTAQTTRAIVNGMSGSHFRPMNRRSKNLVAKRACDRWFLIHTYQTL